MPSYPCTHATCTPIIRYSTWSFPCNQIEANLKMLREELGEVGKKVVEFGDKVGEVGDKVVEVGDKVGEVGKKVDE
eukprot:scaffold6367_cov48-Phaeocystis_antarctica.AAC.1